MSYVQRFSLIAVTAALCFTSPVSAQTATEAPAGTAAGIRDPEAQAAFDSGVKLLTEGKPKEAIAQFNLALKSDDAWADPYLGKAEALKGMKDYQAAAAAYIKARERNPNIPAVYNGLGECEMEVGQYDPALRDFNTALEMDPNNAQVLSNIGHILVNYAQDPVGALRRLDDAIALNDKDARAYRDRGYARVLLREFDKAEADVQKAVEVDPADHENFSVMASVYLLQDKFEPAIAALGHAIQAYKPEGVGAPEQYIDGYLSRADAWLKLGDRSKDAAKSQQAYESVIADADTVLKVYPDRFPYSGSAYYRKGRAQRMLQRYTDAVDSLTQAIQAGAGQEVPYMSDAYMYRGICWYNLKEADLARGDFEQASSTGNGYGDPRVFLWIGYTHHMQGDFREAIASYNEAIAKSPQFALAEVNKGMAYMDLREYRRAVDCFENAIRIEPNVGEHYYKTAYAYMRLRDAQKAYNFMDLALRKENPQPKMYRLAAAAARELGRTELATEYERKAEAPAPQASGQ